MSAATILSHGNNVKRERGRFSAFIRRGTSVANIAGTLKKRQSNISGRVNGVARQSPLVDAVIMR